MTHKIPILFTFDPSLVMPAGVCFTSLLENALPGTFYEIIVIHSARYRLERERLDRVAEIYGNAIIRYIPVAEEFENAFVARGIPETAYYRLISAKLLPEYDKVLYSDVDVIFREDLSKYYDLDLGDSYFAATDNVLAKQTGAGSYPARVLGIDPSKGYYYSGNLVINLAQIRKDGLMDVFRELGRNNYDYQDMDIINIACNGRIKDLGPVFCLAAQLYKFLVKEPERMEKEYSPEQREAALDHGIVHFNGPKPWQKACLNMDIWWYYYRRSIFFDQYFCYDFWYLRQYYLESLTFFKRVKLLLRYWKDKKSFEQVVG